MSRWTPNLSWIEPGLAVGGSFPAEQAACLAAEHGVGAVIDLRGEACDDAGALSRCGVRFLHLPTPDMLGVSQAMLDEGAAFARLAAADGRPLLIHCEHGIGRSATLALCVLIDRGWDAMDALRRAKDARIEVSPSQSQYEAWTTWIRRRHPTRPRPSYHEFGMVAYRHLATTAAGQGA